MDRFLPHCQFNGRMSYCFTQLSYSAIRRDRAVAQKVQVLLVDDLDGGEAKETVKFGLDGVNYEIDLSDSNAQGLRDALATYVEKARKLGRASTGRATAARSRGTSTSSSDREQNRAMREWARRNGYKNVSDRGRISQEIQDAYNARAGH